MQIEQVVDCQAAQTAAGTVPDGSNGEMGPNTALCLAFDGFEATYRISVGHMRVS